jgi:hypothetical protein
VEFDRLTTGGAVVDGVLRVKGIEHADPFQQEYEGAPRWQATNGEAWWVMRSLLQFPPFGRGMETISQLERAVETGPATAAVEAAEAYRGSLTAPAGDLVVEEVIEPVIGALPGAYREPMVEMAHRPAQDYMTTRPGLTPAMEWGALLGIKPVQVDTREVTADKAQREVERAAQEAYALERKAEPFPVRRP